MRIRPLTPEDDDAAREAARSALPPPPRLDAEAARLFWTVRADRFLATDPDGCLVAEDDDGRIVGVALAFVREGIWGLAFLAVRPDVQAQGIGKLLLDASLRHAEGARAGIIASSVDPKAMRRYARAGFDLRPCVAAAGIVDRTKLPGGLRSRETDDLGLLVPLGREIRGGAYDPGDFEIYTRTGWRVLRCGDDGIALHHLGSPAMVLARDEAAAEDLLWSCLAAAPPGTTVDVDFVMGGQDWAIRTLLEAGLPLSPDGPMFTRGELGPLQPWIPAGTFL